jgi:PKD domain-containing protein
MITLRRLSAPLLLSLLGAAFAAPVHAQAFQIGHRPEIGKIDAPKTVKPGEAAQIRIEAKKEGGSGCGMVVNFGDGSEAKQVKVNSDGVKFPITVEHTYKKAGKYTVQVRGKEITTNKECKGSASATIQVGNPNPGKAKGQQK